MAWGTRLRFVDRQGPAAVRLALESLNGGLGRLAVRHFHEAKTPGAAGVLVGNDLHFVYHSIRLEELADIILSGAKRQITHIDIHGKILFRKKSKTIARSSKQYAGAQSQSNT